MVIEKNYRGTPIWNIGSLFAHDPYIFNLCDLLKAYDINNPIKYVFGSPACLFNGGRVVYTTLSIDEAGKIIDSYNKRGVSVRLTFSSTLIEVKDLLDEYCNKLLNYICENNIKYNVKNGVIVSSDKLAKHIRSNYANLELIASLVKSSTEMGLAPKPKDVEYYNELFRLYDMIVINPSRCHDDYFMSNIKYPDRCEIIANHRCMPNCPMAALHYKAGIEFSNAILNHEDPSAFRQKLDFISEKCIEARNDHSFDGSNLNDRNINYLLSHGFNHFKLEGREVSDISFLRDIGDYIFEHEYFTRMLYTITGGAV